MLGNEMYATNNPEDDTDNYRLCKCLNINKKLARYIRARLEADGITRAFIYHACKLITPQDVK
jgi:hypothetical protein